MNSFMVYTQGWKDSTYSQPLLAEVWRAYQKPKPTPVPARTYARSSSHTPCISGATRKRMWIAWCIMAVVYACILAGLGTNLPALPCCPPGTTCKFSQSNVADTSECYGINDDSQNPDKLAFVCCNKQKPWGQVATCPIRSNQGGLVNYYTWLYDASGDFTTCLDPYYTQSECGQPISVAFFVMAGVGGGLIFFYTLSVGMAEIASRV